MRRFLGLLCVLIAAVPVVASPSEERAVSGETTTGSEVVTFSGLKYQEVKPGIGALATKGATVQVHYLLTLANGKKVDSSWDRKEPFTFLLGGGGVIKGFDEGITGMRVGGKRKLILPPELGYGKNGAGNDIPPNSVLIFEIELLKVN